MAGRPSKSVFMPMKTTARRASARTGTADQCQPKVQLLAELMRASSHCVFITGAGISTNSGIRDYRGPNGIWTEAKKQGKSEGEMLEEWDDLFYECIPSATPTFTHRAITALTRTKAPGLSPCLPMANGQWPTAYDPFPMACSV